MLRVAVYLAALLASSYAAMTLSSTVKDTFVNLNNKFRAETGIDMEDMTWDNTLEAYAAGMADKCLMKHDPTMKYGENIFWSSDERDAPKAANDSSYAWKSEIQYVDDVWGCYHGQTKHTCGHYSQQVWQGSTKIGCAVAYCDGSVGSTGTFVFCEYDPPGNSAVWDWDTMSIRWPAPYS